MIPIVPRLVPVRPNQRTINLPVTNTELAGWSDSDGCLCRVSAHNDVRIFSYILLLVVFTPGLVVFRAGPS
jgi:hypothetical protein